MLFHAPYVLALLLQSQPAIAPLPSGLIVGRVVDAGTGAPVPGAILQVSGSALPPAPGSTPPRVMTSPQGQFVIRGLHKGAVNLTVTKPGYLFASYGQLRAGGASRSVSIDSDEAHVTDVELRMWKFGSISGTVVDEAGEPMPGVGVQVFERTYVAGQPRFAGLMSGTTTDDRGMYGIENLAPGDYVIGAISMTSAVQTETLDKMRQAPQGDPQASDLMRTLATTRLSMVPAGTAGAIGIGTFSVGEGGAFGNGSIPSLQPDGALLVYPTVFYPSASHIDGATVVAIRSGEARTGIDLALHPARGVSVSGTIVGPNGPAANMGVHLTPVGDETTVDPIDAATALTDPSGGFTLFGATPGQYTIRVTHVPSAQMSPPEMTTIVAAGGMISGFGMAGGPAAGPIPSEPTLSGNLAVSVGNTDVTGVLVPLKSGGRITGHLEFDGTADKPDASGMVAIRTIPQSADGSRAYGIGPLAGHADEAGAFTTAGVVPGRYLLQVVGARPPWVVRSAMYRGQDLLDSPVAIDSGDVSGVVITLTDRKQGIRGTVRVGPTPDPNAMVFLFPLDAANSTSAGPRRFRGIRTGADGSYAFNDIPPGDYDIVAVGKDPGDGWQNPAILTALAALATPLQVGDGDSKTQDLTTATIK